MSASKKNQLSFRIGLIARDANVLQVGEVNKTYKLNIMATTQIKSIKSKYRYVEIVDVSGKIYYRVAMKGVSRDSFKTEREAAIAADKLLIKKGKEPVNILVRK